MTLKIRSHIAFGKKPSGYSLIVTEGEHNVYIKISDYQCGKLSQMGIEEENLAQKIPAKQAYLKDEV